MPDLHPSLKAGCEFKRNITTSDLLPVSEPNEAGEKPCAWCRVVMIKGKNRRYCSEACSNEFLVRYNTAFAAQKVWQRDQGICQACGLNTHEVRDMLHPTPPYLSRSASAQYGKNPWNRFDYPNDEDFRNYYRELALYKKRLKNLEKSQQDFPWALDLVSAGVPLAEVDHIVPVCEGGGACGLDGLRLLCVPCHKDESKRLAQRRAQQKREQNVERE